MKLILGAIGILLGVALVDVSGKPMSDENKEMLHKLHEECAKTSGIDPETLKKLEDRVEYPETDKMKAQIKCFFQHLGIVDDTGKINAEALETNLKKFVPESNDRELVQKCYAQKNKGKDDYFQLGGCLFTEVPKA